MGAGREVSAPPMGLNCEAGMMPLGATAPVKGFAIGRPIRAEIALIHRHRGNGGELQRMIDAAEAFVIAKDKELVLDGSGRRRRRRTGSD